MNKIGETAIKTYRHAAQTTSKITREIKLKAQMADKKSQIQEIYEEIGKRVYEKHILKEKLDIQLDFKEDCAILDTLANDVENIRIEILNLNNLQQCSKCHYEIDLEFHYCPNCGKEQQLSEGIKQNDRHAKIDTTNEADTILKKTNNLKNINNETNKKK